MNANFCKRSFFSLLHTRSCYAFAAGSVMVGYYEKFQSQNITVSRQEIVDCSRDCGNNGCDGGVEGWSLNYIVLNGISSTEQYPYKAVEVIVASYLVHILCFVFINHLHILFNLIFLTL
jgi:hypothetical protein